LALSLLVPSFKPLCEFPVVSCRLLLLPAGWFLTALPTVGL